MWGKPEKGRAGWSLPCIGERCFLSALDILGLYADHWFATADKSAFSSFQHFDLVSTDLAEIDFLNSSHDITRPTVSSNKYIAFE